MKSTWLEPEAGSNAVTVTFYDSGRDQTHVREVNAIFNNGVYDDSATALRIKEVERGVSIKMRSGAISKSQNEDSA